MKQIFTILLFIFSTLLFGQLNNKSKVDLHYDAFNNPTNAEKAKKDIEKGKVLLYISGFKRKRSKRLNKRDSDFEKAYELTYFPRGCIIVEGDDFHAYNKVMFDYLDKKYGRKWRKQKRSDII